MEDYEEDKKFNEPHILFKAIAVIMVLMLFGFFVVIWWRAMRWGMSW